ncbi:MAG: oligosaccharide flippase family protein [Prevotella sp.]|nr:oligosaccharide flippase family protein [Prevotella sp.]
MKEEREDSYGHVLKYTGIFGGVQGLNILIGLVRNKIVAALLGPSGMGLASLFNTTVNFISQATNFGISFSAVRHVSELFDKGDEQRIRHFVRVVRAWSLLTALLGMLVCIVLGPLLSDWTFDWGDHTLHFIMLAPAVGLMAITGGETAILKGARRLRSLASIQIWNVLVALVIAVPIYYFFGQSGIVPVIVLMALSAMLLTIRHSLRLYPLSLQGAGGILGEGMEMIRLGIAFVAAGILGSGAEMLIRSYLNVTASLDVVGLYNAGFMLTITYGGMVFSAMETDYFPRVSAVARHRKKMRDTVNRQIEVSLLIVSPMLVGLIVFMPIIIPLLFTRDFLPVVAMAQVAVFSMYIKSISLPISYLTLARGDSIAYLAIEAVDDVLLVLFMIFGYRLWGLIGTGVALSAFYLVDILIIYAYTYLRYGFHFSLSVVQYAAIQLPLGLAAYIVTFVDAPLIYWTLGCLLCFVSLAVSLHVLHQKTSLWEKLTKKLKSTISHA